MKFYLTSWVLKKSIGSSQMAYLTGDMLPKSLPFMTIIVCVDLWNENHSTSKWFTSVLHHKFHDGPARHAASDNTCLWDDRTGKILASFEFLKPRFDDIKKLIFEFGIPQIHLQAKLLKLLDYQL